MDTVAERQRQVHEKGVHSEPFRAAVKAMDKLLAEIEGALEEYGAEAVPIIRELFAA